MSSNETSTTEHPSSPLKLSHLAVFAALAAPLCAQAQDAPVAELAPVEVRGVTSEFKADNVQSAKFQAPLVDIPQTINIVPSEVLQQQGAQTLQSVLSNVPGITFTSGEGGAGWGDMFSIRGFSAEQSVTVDGVRESALSTRTDIYNLEQVEVFKGTGSIESGVGAVGGSVNLVTKTPKLDDFYEGSLALGTDKYRRATIDINQSFGDSMAFRLNAMRHKNDVAERNHVNFDRWGVAPSLAWGLGTDTRVIVAYEHQKDKNIPDFGVPISRKDGKRMNGIGRDFWGGLSNVDIEKTTSDSALLRVEHDFNANTSIRNQTSWSQVKRFTMLNTGGRLLNAREWSWTTLPNGRRVAVAPIPGTEPTHQGQLIPDANTSDYWGYDTAGNEVYPTGSWALPRLNPNVNSYKGKMLANQTDLNLDFNTGSIRHQMVAGLELYEESYRKHPISYMRPDFVGQNPVERQVIDVTNPDTYYSGSWTKAHYTDKSGAKVQNVGLYVYDQITLNEQWEIAAGLRYDRYKVKWYDENGSLLPYRQKEGVWSGRLGVIYKPVNYGSIYLSYSQATQPSAADAASRTGGGGDDHVAHYSPGKAKTWELGTKWDLLDEQLLLTAALFQVEKSNPTDADPDDPSKPNIQDGRKERVRGFELGLAGNLTPKWSIYSGLALMDGGKIIKDAKDPSQEGGKLKNVPKTTFNLWTTYAFAPRWDASIGAQYVGKRRFRAGNTVSYGGNTFSADVYAPAYWVANAALSYEATDNLMLRLNVNNIFDKFYLQQASSSSDGFQLFGVPGAGRTIILNADLRF